MLPILEWILKLLRKIQKNITLHPYPSFHCFSHFKNFCSSDDTSSFSNPWHSHTKIMRNLSYFYFTAYFSCDNIFAYLFSNSKQPNLPCPNKISYTTIFSDFWCFRSRSFYGQNDLRLNIFS